MTINQKSLQHFFQSNTLWIYIVLFILFSALLTGSIMKDGWATYSFYIIAFCGIYLPVLLFAYFRKQIAKRFSKWGVRILWIGCFLLYPFWVFYNRDDLFSFLFPIENFVSGLKQIEDLRIFRHGFLSTVSITIVATEVAILINDYFKDWIQQNRTFQRISLDKMLLVLLVLLALGVGFYCSVGILKRGDSQWWKLIYLLPYYAIQVGIILLMYYSFYYLNKEYLISYFLKPKGVIYYGFAAIGSILIFYPIWVFFLSYLPLVQDVPLTMFDSDTSIFAKDRAAIPTFIILLSVPVIVATQWYQQNNQIVNLQKEKSETELNLLKQQINPHFFFNTLNNLYALSITKDKRTPEVILQLSELMRYVIYKGKEELVPLKEEIKYIEDYIELQQLRLHKQLDYRFDKSILNEEQLVPPLLFIIFIENAFKHGIEPAESACYLHLSLSNEEGPLVFSCKNSIENKVNTTPGIGLANLKRRLALRFPDRHTLSLKEEEGHFKAELVVSPNKIV